MWTELRPIPLTDQQLDSCARAVNRGMKHDPLDPEANDRETSRRVREALPQLWMLVEFQALLMAREEPVAGAEERQQLEDIDDALGRVDAARASLHALTDSPLSGFGAITRAHSRALAAIEELHETYHVLHLQRAMALKGRPSDSYTRAALTVIALWWLAQGWQPKKLTDGPIARLTRTLREIRLPLAHHKGIGKQTLIDAIDDASDLHQRDHLRYLEEQLEAGFHDAQLILPPDSSV